MASHNGVDTSGKKTISMKSNNTIEAYSQTIYSWLKLFHIILLFLLTIFCIFVQQPQSSSSSSSHDDDDNKNWEKQITAERDWKRKT